ncbi:MAG: ABC transporter substrate-binding protein, partial [Thermosphaera sp.]
MMLLVTLPFGLNVTSPLIESYYPPLLALANPNPVSGPYLDEIVISQTPFSDIQSGIIHIYLVPVRLEQAFNILSTGNFSYFDVPGLYYELTFNPVGPEFGNGSLNPFSVARIREAINYLVDRMYIVQTILNGSAYPKWVPLVRFFPEYYRYQYTIRSIEQEYSYNFSKAESIIREEMIKLGASYNSTEGKWYYKGSPVVIKVLIRVEDQRRQIGDYVADLLEKLGFTVERIYKTAREAAPIWLRGDPADGQWHVYTG